MAGAAGLEPVTSAVTGQRSNQLSYAPARIETVRNPFAGVKPKRKNIRAADAKEVGVGNPAEETYCYPNVWILEEVPFFVNPYPATYPVRREFNKTGRIKTVQKCEQLKFEKSSRHSIILSDIVPL